MSCLPARGQAPFYARLNEILSRRSFDCLRGTDLLKGHYAETMERSSLTPGVYYRCFCWATSRGSIEQVEHALDDIDLLSLIDSAI